MTVTPFRTRHRPTSTPTRQRIAELEAQAAQYLQDADDPAYVGYRAEFIAAAGKAQADADEMRAQLRHTTEIAA